MIREMVAMVAGGRDSVSDSNNQNISANSDNNRGVQVAAVGTIVALMTMLVVTITEVQLR